MYKITLSEQYVYGQSSSKPCCYTRKIKWD